MARKGYRPPNYGYEPVASSKTKRFEEVAKVASKSDADRVWTVKRNLLDGALSCNCPAWIFNPRYENGKRQCKHIAGYLADVAATPEPRQSAVGVPSTLAVLPPDTARRPLDARKEPAAALAARVLTVLLPRFARPAAALLRGMDQTFGDADIAQIAREFEKVCGALGWQLVPRAPAPSSAVPTDPPPPTGPSVLVRSVRRIMLED